MKKLFRVPQRSLHWGLFIVPNGVIISANSLGSDMLARRYPRGTAGLIVSRLRIVTRAVTLSVLLSSFVTIGCHPSSEISAPTIAFSKVPATDQGSPFSTDTFERDYKTDIMEGRVIGARPGQRMVMYAKTDGRWGVCRQPGTPFTNIETNSRWKASVHRGIQYAALLVDQTYDPPEQTESLPIV